jgi:putative endonuclease
MPPSPSKPGNRAPSAFRRFAEGSGRRGEALAALFLQVQAYRILARRVKTPVGEIDLIARRGKTTVFVEVKARSFSHQETDALYAVNRKRIVRAAQFWLIRHPDRANEELRFDVIFLAPFAWPRHLKNAFDATGIA